MHYPVGKRTKVKKATGIYVYAGKGRNGNGSQRLCYYYTHGAGHFYKVGWNHEGYTLEDAIEARANHVRALRHGDDLPQNNRSQSGTVSEAFERYIDHAQKTNKTYARGDNYKFRKRIEKAIGKRPVAAVNRHHIEQLLGSLSRAGLSSTTRQGYLSTVRRLYSYLIVEKVVKQDPTKGLKVTREEQNVKERYLTPGEIGRLHRAIDAHVARVGDIRGRELKVQFLLGLEMGFRRSEMYTTSYVTKDTGRDYSLRWERIDWAQGVIHILGKGQKLRTVPMTPGVKDALRTLGPKDRGKVFSGLHYQQLNRIIKNAGINAGLDWKNPVDRKHWVSMHTLRHTFASYLTMETKDIHLVSRLLGHSDIQTTSVYAHLIDGAREDAMEQIGALFNRFRHAQSNVVPLSGRRAG